MQLFFFSKEVVHVHIGQSIQECTKQNVRKTAYVELASEMSV